MPVTPKYRKQRKPDHPEPTTKKEFADNADAKHAEVFGINLAFPGNPCSTLQMKANINKLQINARKSDQDKHVPSLQGDASAPIKNPSPKQNVPSPSKVLTQSVQEKTKPGPPPDANIPTNIEHRIRARCLRETTKSGSSEGCHEPFIKLKAKSAGIKPKPSPTRPPCRQTSGANAPRRTEHAVCSSKSDRPTLNTKSYTKNTTSSDQKRKPICSTRRQNVAVITRKASGSKEKCSVDEDKCSATEKADVVGESCRARSAQRVPDTEVGSPEKVGDMGDAETGPGKVREGSQHEETDTSKQESSCLRDSSLSEMFSLIHEEEKQGCNARKQTGSANRNRGARSRSRSIAKSHNNLDRMFAEVFKNLVVSNNSDISEESMATSVDLLTGTTDDNNCHCGQDDDDDDDDEVESDVIDAVDAAGEDSGASAGSPSESREDQHEGQGYDDVMTPQTDALRPGSVRERVHLYQKKLGAPGEQRSTGDRSRSTSAEATARNKDFSHVVLKENDEKHNQGQVGDVGAETAGVSENSEAADEVDLHFAQQMCRGSVLDKLEESIERKRSLNQGYVLSESDDGMGTSCTMMKDNPKCQSEDSCQDDTSSNTDTTVRSVNDRSADVQCLPNGEHVPGDAHGPMYCLDIPQISTKSQKSERHHRSDNSLSKSKDLAQQMLSESESKPNTTSAYNNTPKEQSNESNTPLCLGADESCKQGECSTCPFEVAVKPPSKTSPGDRKLAPPTAMQPIKEAASLTENSEASLAQAEASQSCSELSKKENKENVSCHEDGSSVALGKTHSLIVHSESNVSEVMALISQEVNIKRYGSYNDLTDLNDEDDPLSGHDPMSATKDDPLADNSSHILPKDLMTFSEVDDGLEPLPAMPDGSDPTPDDGSQSQPVNTRSYADAVKSNSECRNTTLNNKVQHTTDTSGVCANGYEAVDITITTLDGERKTIKAVTSPSTPAEATEPELRLPSPPTISPCGSVHDIPEGYPMVPDIDFLAAGSASTSGDQITSAPEGNATGALSTVDKPSGSSSTNNNALGVVSSSKRCATKQLGNEMSVPQSGSFESSCLTIVEQSRGVESNASKMVPQSISFESNGNDKNCSNVCSSSFVQTCEPVFLEKHPRASSGFRGMGNKRGEFLNNTKYGPKYSRNKKDLDVEITHPQLIRVAPKVAATPKPAKLDNSDDLPARLKRTVSQPAMRTQKLVSSSDISLSLKKAKTIVVTTRSIISGVSDSEDSDTENYEIESLSENQTAAPMLSIQITHPPANSSKQVSPAKSERSSVKLESKCSSASDFSLISSITLTQEMFDLLSPTKRDDSSSLNSNQYLSKSNNHNDVGNPPEVEHVTKTKSDAHPPQKPTKAFMKFLSEKKNEDMKYNASTSAEDDGSESSVDSGNWDPSVRSFSVKREREEAQEAPSGVVKREDHHAKKAFDFVARSNRHLEKCDHLLAKSNRLLELSGMLVESSRRRIVLANQSLTPGTGALVPRRRHAMEEESASLFSKDMTSSCSSWMSDGTSMTSKCTSLGNNSAGQEDSASLVSETITSVFNGSVTSFVTTERTGHLQNRASLFGKDSKILCRDEQSLQANALLYKEKTTPLGGGYVVSHIQDTKSLYYKKDLNTK